MNIVTRLMQSSEERRTQRTQWVHRGPCWTQQEFADSVGAKRQALTGLTASGTFPLPPRPRIGQASTHYPLNELRAGCSSGHGVPLPTDTGLRNYPSVTPERIKGPKGPLDSTS